MARLSRPAEWGRLAHLFDEINESFIDYAEQADFVLACRDHFASRARSALDLGCGTGGHAWRLAAAGLPTVGIDLSPALLRRAARPREQTRAATGCPACPSAGAPRFACGDLRALPVAGRFDVVFALNFVFSFLHTNEALVGALSEVRRVVSQRGVFVMDYHVFFPPTAEEPLKRSWRERCRVRGQTLVVTHHPVVDWATQLTTDHMTYRFREGGRVVREVASTEVRRISLPQDLVLSLQTSGFEILRHCARFGLDDPPDGRLGVVIARRKR